MTQARESSGRVESGFYLFDGIHNVRQLTDSSQVVTDEYAFDAWGNTTSSTGSTANSQLWKGQYLAYRKDPNAGPELQYAMHHRNYNPATGVFTAADPAKDDLNLYRYVKNNPVNSTDPSGLISSEEVVDQRSGNHTDHSAAPAVDALGKGFRIGFVEDGFYGDVQMAMYLANPVQVARDAASLAKTHGRSVLAGAMGLNGPFLNPAPAMEVTEKAVSATPMLMQTLEAVKAIPLGGFEAFRAKAPPEIVDAIDVAKSRTEEIVNEVLQGLNSLLEPEIVGRLTGALTYSIAVDYMVGLAAAPLTAGASLALSAAGMPWLIGKISKLLKNLKSLTSGVIEDLLKTLPGKLKGVLEEVGNLIFSKKNRRRDTDLDRSDRKTDPLDKNDQERNDQEDRKSIEEADETSSPDNQPNDTGDSGKSKSTEDSSGGNDRETHTDGDGTDADVDPDAPSNLGKKVRAPQKPNVEKWEANGGTVKKHNDGTVTYTDKQGNKVTYNKEGYPEFKKAGLVKDEVPIDMKGNRTTDFTDADKALFEKTGRKRDPATETWHHNEDGKTMQLMDREIHGRFYHTGGVSIIKNECF